MLTQLPGEFDFQLRFKDGTVHRFDRIIGFTNTAGLGAIMDRNGNTVTITRESPAPGVFGLITRITEPAGRSLDLTYDGAGRITAITDPIGRQVQYAYDGPGRLETVTDPAGGVTRYTYDASNRILTITDPRNITFLTNEYEPATGRVTRQTQADGGIWTFAYTVTANTVTKTMVTDPRGNPTTHRFNSQGFTVSTMDTLGQTTLLEYAPDSNLLTAATDPLGRITRYEYDALGNVTRIIDPAGNPRTFTYEPTFNRLTTITDPLSNTTSFEFDAQGNLTAVVDPVTNRTTLGYNSVGQVTSTTDPLNNTTTFTYDSVGNLTAIADPLGNTTRRAYDAVSRLTQQIDPRGMPIGFTYDALNRTTQILDALSGLTRFTYDGNANLLMVTDARNNATSHTYDSMDRLQTRTDPVNATESFEYDGVGNLTRHTDRKGQVATVTYDALNRRVGTSYVDATTSVSYDAAGRLIRASDSAAGTVVNQYDVLDCLIAQETPLGTIAYQYDPLGRRTQMAGPGQAPTSYSYDAASRLTHIGQGSQLVGFQYDAASRRTRLTLPNQVSTDYQYDAASRLTALIYRHATTQFGDLSYQYDLAGNRTGVGGSFARILLPDPVASATYDAANRQLTFGGLALSYDAHGNLTGDGATTYTWDARNRLAALTGAATTATFQYDPLGRRAGKTINGNQTGFLYDDLNPVQELTGATFPATLLSGLSLDEYLTRTDSDGAQQHFVTDALGSILTLVDSTAILQAQYSYAPFGATSVTGPPSGNPFQYTGRENDGTGLYYYRARYYHPSLGRFISEDPVGLFSGDPDIYAYVANSPLRFTDPLGLDREEPFLDDEPAGLGSPSLDPIDLIGGAAGLSRKLVGKIISKQAAKAGAKRTFEIGPRAIEQLSNPRLGNLAGKLTPERLQQLVNNPAAQRFIDTSTGNINVIQNVDGVLLRISVPRDALRIISVGPIRARGVANGIARGRFIPLQ